MPSMTKQLYAVENLSVGMFISSLDCPAANAPFPLQGFYIKTQEEILELSKYCRFVTVNMKKSQAVRTLTTTLQMAVQDIPLALTNPQGYKAISQTRSPRAVKKSHKGRPKRLFSLLIVSSIIWYYCKDLLVF